MNKVCTDYVVECNNVLEKFAKHIDMNLDEITIRDNWIWVDRLPWIIGIGEYFFSLKDMVETLEYKIPADTVFDWYWNNLGDYKNGKKVRELREFVDSGKEPNPLKWYRKAEKALHTEFEKEFDFIIDNYQMLDVMYYSIPHDIVLEYMNFEHKKNINITSYASKRKDMTIEDITNSLKK